MEVITPANVNNPDGRTRRINKEDDMSTSIRKLNSIFRFLLINKKQLSEINKKQETNGKMI